MSQVYLSLISIPEAAGDTEAYWQAAQRLRMGQPLYMQATDLLATDVYRYAPWFAWMWVPLTFLPRDVVESGWRVAMVGATVVALIPLLRNGTLASATAACLIGWLTLQTALYGNVQPLLVAGMTWSVDRRSGPAWIAIAASLKFVPALYVLVYVARRQWTNVGSFALVAGLLTAPMLLYDLSSYTTSPGVTPSLYSVHPLLWVVSSVIASLIALGLARRGSSAGWLGASVAVLTAYPQLHMSYASHLLVGTRAPSEPVNGRNG